MKNPDLLKKKVRLLEQKLKEKDQILKNQKKALTQSYTRIKNISTQLEKNLSLIRDIHKNLLPVRLPQIHGFEFSYRFLPCQQGVSGDFFDVIKIKDSMNFGFVLSSFNAYAVSSLFLSSFLKFSPHLKGKKTAKDFFSFISQQIFSVVSRKEKIHLFYGIVSASSLELDYCLTGDIFFGKKPPGKDINILPPSAPYFHQKPVQSAKLSIQPGDILLLCSPGVAQRKNQKGQSFGRKNIALTVNHHRTDDVLEIRQNVLFACNEFGKSQALSKDCVVLAIKAKKSVLRLDKT